MATVFREIKLDGLLYNNYFELKKKPLKYI